MKGLNDDTRIDITQLGKSPLLPDPNLRGRQVEDDLGGAGDSQTKVKEGQNLIVKPGPEKLSN